MLPAKSEQPEGSPKPTALEYSQRPPLASIGRHRKLLIFLAICIAVGITIHRNWQPLKHRILWLYWSHRAAAFVMPAQRELYVFNPAEVTALASNPDYVIQSGPKLVAVYSPLVYRQLAQFDPRLKLGSTGSSMEAIAFMGTLIRPDGTARLVIVRNDADLITKSLVDGIGLLALPLPRWFDPVPPVPVGFPVRSVDSSATKVELTSGVVDPGDPSHIIFQFTVYARTLAGRAFYDVGGQIDAYLGNDDSLSLSLHYTTSGPDWSRYELDVRAAPINIKGDVQSQETEIKRIIQASHRIPSRPATRPAGR